MEEYDGIERRKMVKELYVFMGKTTTAIEGIQKQHKSRIHEEIRDDEDVKENIHNIRKSIKDLATTVEVKDIRDELKNVAKAAECPHASRFEKVDAQITACVGDRGKLFGERKYLYGSLTLIMGALLFILKLMWDLKHVSS